VIAIMNEYGLGERTTPIGELVSAGDFAVSII
ncbi:MAG: hypothetical protein RL713_319, partial [Bacteroidota bacterium]